MSPPQRVISPALVAAVAGAALAALLWRVAIEPVDFGYLRYLGIADEAARSGEWVVLRNVDKLYLLKPPLFMWLMAGPISLLGDVPSWLPHLPDLLGLALSGVCIYRLAAAIYGPGDAPMAGTLVFVTTWESFNQATGKRIDPLFAAFLTAAFTAFYLGVGGSKKDGRRPLLLTLGWLFVGLATLTKGPLAIVLFSLVTGVWAAWTGRLRALASPGSLAGIALLVGLCTAWASLLIGRLGYDETVQALRRTSFTTREGGLLLYTRSLLVQQLPWSFFLPALGVWLWKARPWRTDPGSRFLALWFALIFAALHLSSARHQRYLQPATPAFSLLVLSLWYAPGGGAPRLDGLALRLRRAASALFLGALGLVGVLAAVGLALFDRDPVWGRELSPERWIAAPLSLAVALGALGAVGSLRRGGLAERSPMPLALLFLGVLTVVSVLAVGDLRGQDHVAAARSALAPIAAGRPAALLGLFEEQRQMTRLLTRRPVPLLLDAETTAEWARSQPTGAALVITDDAGRHALASLPGLQVRIAQEFELAQERVEILEIQPDP